MTDDVYVEVGGKSHRELLERFGCCKPHVQIPGKRRNQCLEPWSHKIETYIHRDVLPQASVRRRTHDYRLLLLFDGLQLVAVAGHEQVEPAQMTTRYIDFLAVRTDMRGRKLSNGQRCSDAAMGVVLNDINERTPLVTVVTSDVHRQNSASIGFLTRAGALIGPDAVNDLRPVVLLRL